MSLHSCFGPSFHFRIRCRAFVSLLVMAALACSSPAFCDEIHDAAKNGDLAKVQALLKDHPDLVFSKDNDGDTPLHLAAEFGRKDVAELLLANKADVNAKREPGAAKAMSGVESGCVPVAAGGCLINLPAFIVASSIAQSDAATKGFTPLHYAARKGYRDMAELLLANKADVNAKTNLGATSLHWAAHEGHRDVAELLLTHSADVNSKALDGGTPLHWAAAGGFKDVAEFLLSNKAEVNAEDKNGATPLHEAVERGYKNLADLLLVNKAEVNAKDKDGATPLHNAALRGHKDMAELLLSHEAEVNVKDNDGATPLHNAALGGHKEVAELLLSHGAEVNVKDNHGATPLHYASLSILRHKDVEKLLRQHGGHK